MLPSRIGPASRFNSRLTQDPPGCEFVCMQTASAFANLRKLFVGEIQFSPLFLSLRCHSQTRAHGPAPALRVQPLNALGSSYGLWTCRREYAVNLRSSPTLDSFVRTSQKSIRHTNQASTPRTNTLTHPCEVSVTCPRGITVMPTGKPVECSDPCPNHPLVLLTQQHLVVLLRFQMPAERPLQRRPALGNGRQHPLNLAQVAPHALHMAGNLLREREQLFLLEVLQRNPRSARCPR